MKIRTYAIAAAAVLSLSFSPFALAAAPLPSSGISEPTAIATSTGDKTAANNYGHKLGAFHTYRIVSTVQLNDGTILLSYDGRPDGGDSPSPNSILQRRSTDGGTSWEPETFIHEGHVDNPDDPHDAALGYSDPSYVYDAEKDIVFNFHVWSKDKGFADSSAGTDDNDRNIVSAEVSTSRDQGKTYTHRSVTKEMQEEGLVAAFASSGHGIQIKNGTYKGRLVVQFAGRYEDGSVRAFSLFSDDHGQTWQRGKSVGTNMNENKVVELQDGRLMLNSRIPSGTAARFVAYSDDGGQSWGEISTDTTLIDPSNNASIIRKHADAQEGTPESKELLLSNAASIATREKGSVRYSCDDGATWPVIKTFEPGEIQYSDLVELKDGTYGIFYEAKDKQLRWRVFSDEWLKPFCAAFSDAQASVKAGETVVVKTTVKNTDTQALPAGTAPIRMSTANAAPGEEPTPSQWSAGTANVPALQPGESAEVSVELSAPKNIRASVGGASIAGDIVVNAGEVEIRGDLSVVVTQGTPVQEHPDPDVFTPCPEYVDGVTPGTNLIKNCDFEGKSSQGTYGDEWEVRYPDAQTAYVAEETLSDGTINHYGIIDTGGFDAYFQQRIPTVPGKQYVYEADIRVNASDGYIPSAVFFTAKGWDSVNNKPDQGSTQQLTIGQIEDAINWTHKSITFTARDELTDIGVIKWAPNDAEGHVGATTIGIDNVSVREADENGNAIEPAVDPGANDPDEDKPGDSDKENSSEKDSSAQENEQKNPASAESSKKSERLKNTGSALMGGAVLGLAALAAGSGLLIARRRSQRDS